MDWMLASLMVVCLLYTLWFWSHPQHRADLWQVLCALNDTLTEFVVWGLSLPLRKRPDYQRIAGLECDLGLYETGLTCWSCGRISIRDLTPVPRGVQSPCAYCGMAAIPSIAYAETTGELDGGPRELHLMPDGNIESVRAVRQERPSILLPTGNMLPARHTIVLTGEQGPELIPMRWVDALLQAMRIPAEFLQPSVSLNEALARSEVETFKETVRARYGIHIKGESAVSGNPHGVRSCASGDRSLTAERTPEAVTAERSKEVGEDAGREIIGHEPSGA